MLTKYILTIGGVAHQVPDECLMNWDDISFSLKRTDYSGVMRSFSTEFVFVGEAYDLLRDAYLTNGVLTEASIAVLTINNDHTWTEQFSSPLDFSSIEMENGKFTVTAIDNALASLIKSKKGQKYEFPVTDFSRTNVEIKRMSFSNLAKFVFPTTSNAAGYVNVRLDEDASTIISTEFVEPANESNGYDGTEINRFFAKVNQEPSPLVRLDFSGRVLCRLQDYRYNTIAELRMGFWVDDNDPHFQLWNTFCDNDITKEFRYGSWRNKWIGKSTHANYNTLDALKAAAAANTDIFGLYPGYFGIVGRNTYPNESYWTDNVVYMYQGNGNWISRGAPASYQTAIEMTASASFEGLTKNQYPMLMVFNPSSPTNTPMTIYNGKMSMTWTDSARDNMTIAGIKPQTLLQRIVANISPTATASIAPDEDGLINDTYIFAAESLRRMPDAKVYSTFKQFADWMEAVFGYTYRIVGDEVQFVHRSEVFTDEVGKVIDKANDVKYSVNDSLIYTEVDAGYNKKEYGEINGRLEINFTNYYETGYNLTDNKLSLISKYRSDKYGVEFTIRKGEKTGETTDDKNDEDVFFVRAVEVEGTMKYVPDNNHIYNPAACVNKNASFITAMGNGDAVRLTMTSSDGNNSLADIEIPAGTALFTVGELEFSTDDTDVAEDPNSLVQLDYKGYRYTGYIKEAKARFGRVNGMEYTLIVKTITTI